jgi:hypothetical protein
MRMSARVSKQVQGGGKKQKYEVADWEIEKGDGKTPPQYGLSA